MPLPQVADASAHETPREHLNSQVFDYSENRSGALQDASGLALVLVQRRGDQPNAAAILPATAPTFTLVSSASDLARSGNRFAP